MRYTRHGRHGLYLPNQGVGAHGIGGGWSPAQLDNLWAWYDCAGDESIVSSGGLVSQLTDLSGNSRHLTPDATNNKPTHLSEGVIEFDGVDDDLNVSNQDLTSAEGISASIWLDDVVATGGWIFGIGSTDFALYFDDPTEVEFYANDLSPNKINSFGVTYGDLNHIVFIWDAVAGETSLYINNTLAGPVAVTGTIGVSNGDFHLGSRSGSFMTGMKTKYDFLVTTDVLTGPEIAELYARGAA